MTYQVIDHQEVIPFGSTINHQNVVYESVLYLMRNFPHRNNNDVMLFTDNRFGNCLLSIESKKFCRA